MRNLSIPFALSALSMPATPAGEAPEAPAEATVEVVGALERRATETTLQGRELTSRRLATDDAARLLEGVPGLGFQSGGGIASLPVLDGMADDRLAIRVDGVPATSSCPNHMNPALSAVDAGTVSSLAVFAGITPVSLGGDSLGGVIAAETFRPFFQETGEGLRSEGRVAAQYRSLNQGGGLTFSRTLAGPNLCLSLTGSAAGASDYHDGRGARVTSTYYQSRQLGLAFAARTDTHLFTVKVSGHAVPRQGFTNQQMDLTGDRSTSVVVADRAVFPWGVLHGTGFWKGTRHAMDAGRDKGTFPAPMVMPMNTRGEDLGGSVKAELPFAGENTLRLGSDLHRFTLDDTWPPVAGEAPAMGPDPFHSIRDGRREQFGAHVEWESRWTKRTTTLLGVRTDRIRMDTGPVQGYSSRYAADADAFNARDRARRDRHWGVAALIRMEPAATLSLEAGFAQKTRSPNLYERYAWSTNLMASAMINWFGDGNFYVGDPALRPETAQILSATAVWRSAAPGRWDFKVTPSFTRIRDAIDVKVIASRTYGQSTFNQLRFTNVPAEIRGLNLSGRLRLWEDSARGQGRLRGSLGYLRGTNGDTGQGLYHMMPLNARVALEHTRGAWDGSLEWERAERKSRVDPLRREPETPAYTLVHLRGSYTYRKLRLELGVANLFHSFYELPLGGVDIDSFMARGWTGRIQPLAGPGRSINASVILSF